ncbi:MAG: hypothetical protein ABI212_02175 [Burkholderiaceae bacterium]
MIWLQRVPMLRTALQPMAWLTVQHGACRESGSRSAIHLHQSMMSTEPT